MLQRARAIRAPYLPKVTYCARYLWSIFSYVEKARMHCIGEWTEISEDGRNMLLVIATLLITVTYQGVISKVLRTDTVKEPKNELITGFLVGLRPTDGQTDEIINNLIITYLNYVNN